MVASQESVLTSLFNNDYAARTAQTSSSTPATVITNQSLSRQLSGLVAPL
jgi:hypothetical protein